MSVPVQRLSLRRPDDWHLHLRDGPALAAVLPYTAQQFARAIIMPNLVPPVTTIDAAVAYRERILKALPAGLDFTPLMTCYLTDATEADEVGRGFADGVFTAVKLYPDGATTHSSAGVSDWRKVRSVLERMQKIGMPLLLHGETTDPDVDIFDREAVFLKRWLQPLLKDLPDLKVVLEHATTDEGVGLVRSERRRMSATITAHHLFLNRNDMLVGGIRPHHYCNPVPKRERHRLALRKAATSGEACFFLGTDSAPHRLGAKECACGAAGVFTAPSALSLYAQAFDEDGALDKLEAFASLNGPAFYKLPANTARITLERSAWTVPARIALGTGEDVHPFRGGEMTAWTLAA